MIPCAGELAKITNSVLYDLEGNGSLSLGTIAAIGTIVWNIGACFGAGTPILTPDGSKPIEAIRRGDWVITAPEDSPDHDPVARRVEEVFHNRAALYTLKVGGREIRSTADHPFWVQGRGWTAARDLIEGDRLRSHDGHWARVGSVAASSEKFDVYNFRVSEHHTYFVGSRDWGFSVWAHNVDQCTVDLTLRNSHPYNPGEVCPTAYDPDTGTIYIGPNMGHGQGHAYMEQLPAFLGWPGVGGGSLIGPKGPGAPPLYLNGGTDKADPPLIGIPVNDWPAAQRALERWTGSPTIDWRNYDPGAGPIWGSGP
jgi:Pretoxin HINT domain